jgi:acyl-CoA hydrolase
VSKVSAWVEDDRPLFTLPPSEIGPVQQAIARHVAPLIEDGDTLQIGIGGIRTRWWPSCRASATWACTAR